MPKIYKRVVGKGERATVDPEKLRLALKAVTEEHMPLREAAKKFEVNHVSIHRRLKNPDTQNKPGRTTALSQATEISICKRLITCTEWGYPLTMFELQQLIAQFLADNNIEVPRFTNNIPGIDYLREFLKRHRETLTFRLCRNIQRKRSSVNVEVVTEYYNELSKALEGVPPGNIFNYDETNFSDNPDEGINKVLFKRNAKYVDPIDCSKSGHSVMFCGNSLGQMLPIYVVYKSSKMCDTWVEGGPQQTRYNRSQNGWFDKVTFEDWMKSIVVPAVGHLDGFKILVGDNLSSHMSLEIIRLCELYSIKFVFLPSNSIHLLQPLHVEVFDKSEHYWREILTDWRRKNSDEKVTSISKTLFPSLLMKLMNKVNTTLEANVISGFRECGIHPLNLTEMLNRLLKVIKQNYHNNEEQPKQQRKKKQRTADSKRVSAEDLLSLEAMAELLQSFPSTSTGIQQKREQMKKPSSTVNMTISLDSDSSDSSP